MCQAQVCRHFLNLGLELKSDYIVDGIYGIVVFYRKNVNIVRFIFKNFRLKFMSLSTLCFARLAYAV
jgi:hypothetical protein